MRFAKTTQYFVSKTTIENSYKIPAFDIDSIKETGCLQALEENGELGIPLNDLNTTINNEMDNNPSFDNYVNVDDEIRVAYVHSEDGITQACQSSSNGNG